MEIVCDSVQSPISLPDNVASGNWRIVAQRQSSCSTHIEGNLMNSIIYIVGLIVIVLFILGFFGLR